VVEDGRLRGARCRAIVVAGDGMQELGENRGLEILRALLDHPEAEMDVAEQAALFGLPECRAASKLAYAADVVEQSCSE